MEYIKQQIVLAVPGLLSLLLSFFIDETENGKRRG